MELKNIRMLLSTMVTTRFLSRQIVTRSTASSFSYYRHICLSSRIRPFSHNSIKKKNRCRIRLDHTYDFSLANQIRFDGIPEKELYILFQDGRFVSPLLESWITRHFPLTKVGGNQDHDHIDPIGKKYDMKNFTKYGLKFMPSNQVGSGRMFNPSAARKKANRLIYICCNVTAFPDIQIRFVKGNRLFERYPSCHIPPNQRNHFFMTHSNKKGGAA